MLFEKREIKKKIIDLLDALSWSTNFRNFLISTNTKYNDPTT